MDKTLINCFKLVHKIADKMGDELGFTIQAGMDKMRGPESVKYMAMIDSPKKNMEPIVFASLDLKEFENKLKDYYKGDIDRDSVAIVWHDTEIDSLERKIEAHKAAIIDINNTKEKKSAK